MDASPAPLELAVPAPCYLVGAVVLGASTVVAPKRSPTAYVTLLAMAGSVYRYITAPHGSDFGLAMVFTTYVFQVCAMRIRSTAERVADSKLPKRQLDWLVMTFLNPRMVGWGGPVGPLQPRTKFIAEQIVQLIPSLLAIDLCHGYFAASTWYSHDAPLFGVRIATLPVWKQATHTAAWAIYAYLLWFLPYKIFAVASVSLRFTEPQDWPQLCASWTEADSVSALWGRVWHQSHRRTYTTLAEAAADRGQLSPAVKRYFKVTTAFTISAVVHAAGSLALPPDPVTGDRGCKGALVFFALQALAVCGERWLGQLTTVRPPKLLRYAWLVCWGISTLILSGWMDELVARRSIPPGVRSVLVDLWTSR